jgi:alpha-amylase
MIKRILTTLLLLSFLSACVPAAPTVVPTPKAESTPKGWWRDSVFYEIFVRSFYDSDGNGIGDFNGITEKLDYIQSLGVNAIWLMPIHPSPSYHGYDVIEYYKVNPDYGTMNDFKNLLKEAHKRGIHIIHRTRTRGLNLQTATRTHHTVIGTSGARQTPAIKARGGRASGIPLPADSITAYS